MFSGSEAGYSEGVVSKSLAQKQHQMLARWQRKRREAEEALLTRPEAPSEAELFGLLDPDATKWEPFTATDFQAAQLEPGELERFTARRK